MSFIRFLVKFFLLIYPPPERSTISSLPLTHVLSFPLGFSLSLSLSLRGHAAVSFLMWTKDPSHGGHKIWIRVKRILSAVAAAVVDRQE
jgi:hypothetical protein